MRPLMERVLSKAGHPQSLVPRAQPVNGVRAIAKFSGVPSRCGISTMAYVYLIERVAIRLAALALTRTL